MSGNNIRNVLVLGTEDDNTLEFVNSFETHLQFDNYEDSLKWQSNLSNVKVVNGIKNYIVMIENERFNFIHATTSDYTPQQIISVLLCLLHKQNLSAIIFLVNPSEMDNQQIWKYKCSILSKLNQFADKNILYLMMANNDSYKQEQFILNSFRKERSEFYFQKNIFYKLSKENWQENVEFSKSIYNYIVGDKNTKGLQDYFIQSVIPVAAMLKLADDLMEFLIQIYICAEYAKLSYDSENYYFFYIRNYKNNVTTCYDNNCIKWLQHNYNPQLKLKISKICHGPCKCSEFDTDVSRCTMFDTSDKTCLQCDCKSESHSKKCFEFSCYSWYDNLDNEKCIAMKMLATFYLYKQQNQQVYNFENIFFRLLDVQDTKHQTIFDNFKIEFNEEIQKFDEKSNVITCENILLCLKELYQITNISEITPQFIEDIFPKDFRLEIITEQIEPNEETEVNAEREIPKINNEMVEMVDDEITELKEMMKEMLILIKNNFKTGQNINDLNPKLNPNVAASNINLNQNEKQNEEEVNWNIESKQKPSSIMIPKMPGDDVKHVLVVGTPGREASKFINKFGTYLQCSTHEEAIKWNPDLTKYLSIYDVVKDITKTTMQIENKTFNFIHPSNSDCDFAMFPSPQVIAILLHYLQKQKLTAIIFLVQPTYIHRHRSSKKYDENGIFKSCLFSGLDKFADNNVLYVCNNEYYDSEQIRAYLDASKVERNIFYFQDSAFHEISEDNWLQFVKFSKSIYNYIVGNEIINGLPDYYMQSLIPEKCVLKLVNDLTMLLIQIYICAEYGNISNRLKNGFRFEIMNHKKYVAVCYDCATWMQKEYNNVNIKMKIPAVCHVPCRCADISKCTIFETSNGRCCQCNHGIKSHTKYSFQFVITAINEEGDNKKKKQIAIKTLSTFFLYKKQNQEEYNVKSICKTLLDMEDSSHSSVFKEFETQFDQEVQKSEKKSELITIDTIMMCLSEFNRQAGTYAIWEYMDDIFPKENRLEINAEQNNSRKHLEIKNECEISNINDDKIRIETLRNEIVEMKQMLQNANDLNSKLIQDMQILTERCRLNQNEEEPKEKEIN